jgi:hypothetical protein
MKDFMIRSLTVTDNDDARNVSSIGTGSGVFRARRPEGAGVVRFGFFMNWAGTQKGERFEFHLLVLAITAFLMIRGAGAASVDRLLSSPATKSIPAKVRPQAA